MSLQQRVKARKLARAYRRVSMAAGVLGFFPITAAVTGLTIVAVNPFAATPGNGIAIAITAAFGAVLAILAVSMSVIAEYIEP